MYFRQLIRISSWLKQYLGELNRLNSWLKCFPGNWLRVNSQLKQIPRYWFRSTHESSGFPGNWFRTNSWRKQHFLIEKSCMNEINIQYFFESWVNLNQNFDFDSNWLMTRKIWNIYLNQLMTQLYYWFNIVYLPLEFTLIQ